MKLEASVMNSRISAVLREAAFLMFGLQVNEEKVDSASQLFIEPLTSSVTLKGPLTMIFTIRIETDVARQIVKDVTDCLDPSTEDCHDFVRELANVVAGNFKSRLPESTDGFFSLTPPYDGEALLINQPGWILSTRIPFSSAQGLIEVIAHVH